MIRFYALLFLGFAVFVVFHWLANLPSYVSYNLGASRAAGTLPEVDLRDLATIKKYISQGYGASFFALVNYADKYHNGIDIVARKDASILSPAAGKVVALGNQDKFCPGKNYGKFLVVSSKNGGAFLFAHLSKIQVEVDERIEKGKVLGNVGQTGFATAPHLHFTVFQKDTFKLGRRKDCGPNPEGKDTNPLKYLESL